MKKPGTKGAAGQRRETSPRLTADVTAQSVVTTSLWAEYGEALPSQSPPIISVASGLRILYDDVIRQPLPARIGELASSLSAKESWR